LKIFKGLIVLKEKKESAYLAAYLSCWLCVFPLPEIGNWLICPETFETASLMASGCTYSLAVPIFTSLYYGLHRIAHAPKPSYSRFFFLIHYLYGWLAHYFQTHHVPHPAPPGPLIGMPHVSHESPRDHFRRWEVRQC